MIATKKLPFPAFHVNNDTDKWIVITDHKFGMVDTCDDATTIMAMIPGHIEETPFYLTRVIRPWWTDNRQTVPSNRISDHIESACDIKQYVIDELQRTA